MNLSRDIDFAIRGEGEAAVYELENRLENCEKLIDVKGLIYRHKNEIIGNIERNQLFLLESLPFPARDLMVNQGLKIALVMSLRGCAGNGSFCLASFLGKNGGV